MDKVLIIKDNVAINILLSARLRARKFHVKMVETGEEGIRNAQKNEYDLILLDIGLPGIDGFEVLNILRSDSSTESIPVIIITAKGKCELAEIKAKTNADGYLAIPFTGDQLIEKVESVLSKHQKKCFLS